MRRARAGFTLLEVLVAVAILGLGLTMILSSQVGLFSSAARAQHLTIATNLLRCRMSEAELELVQQGYPLIDESDEGACCAERLEEDYRCRTQVERVELPEPTALPEGKQADQEPDPDLTGLLSGLSSLREKPPTPGDPNALQEIAKTIGASTMETGLGPMVLGMVYPQLKRMLEASIRKVTVTVLWKEGRLDRELKVTQFVTDPKQGELDDDPEATASGSASPGMLGLGVQP